MRLHNGLCAAAATAAMLIATAACASDAWAGRFHVYSCRTPDGRAAPADGWSGSKTGTYTYAENGCQSGGALVAALRNRAARTANTDIATWAFTPGVDEALAAATLWRAGDADGGQTAFAVYGVWFAGPENKDLPSDAFAQCFNGPACQTGVGDTTQPFSGQNRVVVPAKSLGGGLYFDATCSGESGNPCREDEHDAQGYAAVVYLYAADLTLEQAAGPSASALGGELASAPAVSGTSDLTFTASDPGAGVYRANFTVDGRLIQSSVIDDNEGRCREVGQTTDGLPAFLYVQPCKPSVSADVGLDTTTLANGPHHLVVTVSDAAGNSAPVLDRNITVANPTGGSGGAPGGQPPNTTQQTAGGQPLNAGAAGSPPPGTPNGAPASPNAKLTVAWRGTRGTRLTLGYGRSAAAVGRLTGPGGAPIAGARIAVEALPAYTGAAPVQLAALATGADGRFSLRLAGVLSSRSLRFSYRWRFGDPAPAAVASLSLAVRASISLGVSPRSSTVGHSIHFHGLLRGAPIPRAGKQLVLEARSPGGSWLEFDVVRADLAGRYRASYRFRFPGPATYQFRVLSEAESDYPYAAGTSNVVVVRER